MTENVKILALRLLHKFEEHISAQLILLRYQNNKVFFEPDFDCNKGPIGFTGLHGAAFLGIVEIFAAVLEMKEWDVNAMDNASCTPLIWSAARGHEEVVKMLLERGDVNLDLADNEWSRTPLMWATVRGHKGVVKVFLEREVVNRNQANSVYGPIALYMAAAYGHAGVVKMILEREDINPNQIPTGCPCTPLSIAAFGGHEGVVKILLEREDVNPNIVDTDDGLTPLADAAGWGHEGVVKMLLDRNDIRTDIHDHKNQTAHSLALSEGYDEIARMISEGATSMSDTADLGSLESLPASAGDQDEFMAEMELRDDHSNATTADPNEHLHPHQQTPIRRRGIGLRRLFFRFRR